MAAAPTSSPPRRRLSVVEALLFSAAAMGLIALAMAAASLPIAGDRLIDSFDVTITGAVIDEHEGRALVLLRSIPEQDLAGATCRLGVQDLSELELSPRLLQQPHEVTCLLGTPHGAVAGDVAGTVCRLPAKWTSGRSQTLGTQTDGGVAGLACSPDGARLISWGNKFLYLWDLPAGQLLRRFPRESATSVVLPIDGEYFYQDRSGDVIQRSLATGDVVRTILSRGDVLALALHPDGRRLASLGYDGWLCVSELPSGKALWEVDYATAEAIEDVGVRLMTPTLAFGPNGCVVCATRYGDGTSCSIDLWQEGQRRASFATQIDHVLGAAFAKDRRLYAWGADRTLHRWDLSPELAARLDPEGCNQ